MKKTICHVLVFAMLLALFASVMPAFRLHAAGSYTFDFRTDSHVVVIDAQFIAEKNGATHFNIPSGVFSVTVIGNIDVTLIFTEDTTIDRSADTQDTLTTYVDELREAGERLAESDDSWNYGNGQYYVPTCPFRITGGARVRVSFSGKTEIRAGYNGWVSNGTTVTNVHGTNGSYRGGYAAIQVDGDSSLTIDAAPNKLKAYGAYPLAGQTVNDVTYPTNPLYANPYFNAYYDDTERVSLSNHGHNHAYDTPSGISNTYNGGGAGIGGGVSHDTTISRGTSYTAGTPGEIIINGGVITAAGGHQAAGIGGSVNGSATTSKIEINGGNITAIGGRWACGIGDGDSMPNDVANIYKEEKQIIINGGTVHAYGGTAAAAIGTTDAIGQYHGLTLIFAGGDITALSGEAQTGTTSATAAIGAGEGTDMNNNSITVSSKATVSASSFSKYAISNCGTNLDEIPSVNIDPDGYMYLARFDTGYIAEDKNREFVCYHVKADAKGNPMLLPQNAAEIADFGESTYEGLYYALNRTNKRYYLVKADGTPMTEADAINANVSGYTVDLTDGLVYPDTIPNLSYYYLYLKDKIVETYSVPAQYKAIALTLPDPTLVSVSGTYILQVPDNEVRSDVEDTYVVIQKPTAGTGSGEIDASNATHVNAGTNDGTVTLTPNITEDAVAEELISLAVEYGEEELIKKYHGRFYPTTYAYTVYLPRKNGAAIDFDLSFTYDKENVENIDIIIGGRNDSDSALTGSYKGSYTLGANEEKMEIWIKKTDKQDGQSSPPSVIYKITVIRKPLYVLEMKPMSKVYDGEPVKAVVENMYIPGEGLSEDIRMTDLKDKEPTGGTSSSYLNEKSMETLTSYSLPTIGESGTAKFNYGRNKTVEMTVTHSIKALEEPGQYNVITNIAYKQNNSTQNLTLTIQVDLVNGLVTTPGVDSDGVFSEAISNFEIVKTGSTDTSATIVLQSDDWWNTYKYSLITVSIGDSSVTSSMDEDDVAASKQEAVQTAVNAMTESLEGNHWTMASEIVEYSKGTVTANYELGIETATELKNNKITSTSSEVSYQMDNQTLTGRVLVTATYEHDVDMTSLLSAEDMANIKYEYHLAATGDIGSGEHLHEAPSDAGTYHVRATLEADTFEAEGVDEFVIERRVIHITGVKNWRTYLSETQVTEIAQNNIAFLEVTNYESFVFDNLVDKDEGQIVVEMQPNKKLDGSIRSAVIYYEGGEQLQISYTPTKILILPVRLDETDAVTKNYRFPDAQISTWYAPEGENDPTWYGFTVPGELSYVVDDAMFKKDIVDGGETEWQKFWPDGADDPLQWETDDQGNIGPAEGETRIDYHSPSNSEHREYIYMHTVNEGERRARYAVDIEYGALQYTYSKTVWDVNKHEYVSVTEESYWSGNDGANNRITIYNRSNRDIYYSAEATLDEYFGAGCNVCLALSTEKPTDGSATRSLVNIEVQRTEEYADEAMKESFYVYLDGIPQISSPNDGLRSTGKVIVTVTSTRQETQNE